MIPSKLKKNILMKNEQIMQDMLQLFQLSLRADPGSFSISLESVGSRLYFTKKNGFAQTKAVRIYPTTVSITSEPAVTV